MLSRMYPPKDAILMGSGNYFDCFSPETSKITDEDIAYGLGFQTRFRGQTVEQANQRRCMYVIADHSLRVAALVSPRQRLAALMHEAGEVIWGDMATPQKRMLRDFKEAEMITCRAVWRLYGISDIDEEEIKRADLTMLATERRDLMPATTEIWEQIANVDPLPDVVVPLDPHEAAKRFLSELQQLRAERDLVKVEVF